MEIGIRRVRRRTGCLSEGKTYFSWQIFFPKEFAGWLVGFEGGVGSLRLPGVIILPHRVEQGNISLFSAVDEQPAEMAFQYIQYLLKRAQEYCRGFGEIPTERQVWEEGVEPIELDDVPPEEPFSLAKLKQSRR